MELLYVSALKFRTQARSVFSIPDVLPLIVFSFFLNACGGPPQMINEGSESPALIVITHRHSA
jgi:hypothetical protein